MKHQPPLERSGLLTVVAAPVFVLLIPSLLNVTVKTMVETADTAYVIVPHVPGEGELSDSDLEKVAGGFLDKNANCNNSPGAMNTI